MKNSSRKKMPSATKTLNPLHFEDLEPHRFEDLVRQLIYDFRDWRSLEPTGRLGADDGYDARGFEITNLQQEQEETEEDEEHEELRAEDRLWQIQCKREKVITPAKLEKYLDEMIPDSADVPYGVIFAAPSEFSKKTRDLFRRKLREKSVQEFYLWGRADLEDMLYLPKNDHLLYGFFGVSLVIRRRTVKSAIRSLLATKRKAVKHLGPINRDSFTHVLLRDATDTKYPYTRGIPDFNKKPRWKMYDFVGHVHDGIRMRVRRYPAYREIDRNTGELVKWDYSDEVNLGLHHDDVWNKGENYDDDFHRAHDFLDSMPEQNRAFFEIEGVIPYERIIEIDPLGDNIANCPHVFVETRVDGFFDRFYTYLTSRGSFGYTVPVNQDDEEKRIKYFPKKFPKAKPISPLPPMGSGNRKLENEEEEFKGLKKDE